MSGSKEIVSRSILSGMSVRYETIIHVLVHNQLCIVDAVSYSMNLHACTFKGAMTRAAHATRNYKRLHMLFAHA